MAKKPASLYPYREAQITPTMMIVGMIIIVIMSIICFLVTSVPALA